MYLREMGSSNCCRARARSPSPSGIEAGRDMMIGGICENPADVRALLCGATRSTKNKMLARHHRFDATTAAPSSTRPSRR